MHRGLCPKAADQILTKSFVACYHIFGAIGSKKESTLELTNTRNQKNKENKNVTTVDLGECENQLKFINNISDNNSLYIIKYDIYTEGMNIPKIGYNIYYPFFNNKLVILNISVCENMDIDISIPTSINKSDIDKYNSSSDYYNNICSKATANSGTDIPLKIRKNNFINNNMTLCEENCKLIDYNYTTEKAKCSCNIKTSFSIKDVMNFDKNKLYKSFIDIENIANINLVKCFKTVYKGKSLINNYGFFIFVYEGNLFSEGEWIGG